MLSDFSEIFPFGSYLKENNRRVFRCTQYWQLSHITTDLAAPTGWVASGVLSLKARLCLRAEQPVKGPAGSSAGPQAKTVSSSSAPGSPELKTVPVICKDFLKNSCPYIVSFGLLLDRLDSLNPDW